MRATLILATLLALVACEKKLSPLEQAAKDRAECMLVATKESGFDPITAEEPPRTVSSSHERGGTFKEGAVDVGKGAAGGAVLGVVGGAIAGDAGKGAAAGAAVGGLIGGARHYQKRNEVVTVTKPNPAYQEFTRARTAYKDVLAQCMAARAPVQK